MARLTTLLVFTFLALYISSASAGRKLPNAESLPSSGDSRPTNFTHVCDPMRYAALGLNMSTFAFCHTNLTYEERATDLVNQMTLYEKVKQLGDIAYGVPRLGLPGYKWWSEALHGVSDVGRGATHFDSVVPGATSFPTVILTAASFNESLWKNIGQVVSTEARAMYNLGRAGLTFWSPNINVVRDPRWGRALETPGEDPFVVGRYAVNYVRGLQDVEGAETSEDPNQRPLKVSSCCKHYAAYDIDEWNGVSRFTFDAKVTERDMVETFLGPFEMCVKEGDVSSVMCSYNRVNGIPTCADPKLLQDTIRGDWGLHGYIVSDCDSIQVMVDGHKFLGDTREDAVARSLKAGLDLDCGDYYTNFTTGSIIQGKARESEVDRSLIYLYIVLMRLGYFDGIPAYASLGEGDICTDDNVELAAEAAREGIVLLKNLNSTLPLSVNAVKSVAVIGPHANATAAMIGNYAGVPCRYRSSLQGFSSYANVTYKFGCDNVKCKNDSFIFDAVEAAQNADATVIVAGIDLSVEAESLDRVDLLLPGYQTQLINRVAQVSKGPVILVIMSAGGLDISFARDNPQVSAILWAGYPGEEGGQAIADAIFGKYSPGGRLPLTWHTNDYVKLFPMTSMPLRPVVSLGYPGRTYKFFNGSTVYPFGYGLSYTQFNYTLKSARTAVGVTLSKLQHCHSLNYTEGTPSPWCPAVLVKQLACKDNIEIEIEVSNTGNVDGSEVVIVYSKPPEGVADTHIKQVVGFQRVFIPAGKSQDVSFKLNACNSLGIVDYAANHLLASGVHTIIVGDNLVTFPVQVNLIN